MNMNEDPMLHGKLSYSLVDEYTHVGRKNGNPVPQIIINGMGIYDNHAVFHNTEDKIFLKPISNESSEFLFVNGIKVLSEQELFHNDRVIFGKSSAFLLQIPGGPTRNNEVIPEITWEFAQTELINNNQI